MVEWIVCAKDRVRTFFEKSTASAVADFTQRCDPKDINEITFGGVRRKTQGAGELLMMLVKIRDP